MRCAVYYFVLVSHQGTWRSIDSNCPAPQVSNKSSDNTILNNIMAKGKTGLWIEGFKFTLYLGIPLLASWYYSDPVRQKASADYWKYIEYPPNPTTGLREQIMEQERIHNEQKEQREAYREQLRKLDELANSTATDKEQGESKGIWSRWFGRK